MGNVYLGPKRMPKWNYPYWYELQDIARSHDKAYKIKIDRKISDQLFLEKGLFLAKSYGIKMKIVVIIYWILLRLFGWISFYFLNR